MPSVLDEMRGLAGRAMGPQRPVVDMDVMRSILRDHISRTGRTDLDVSTMSQEDMVRALQMLRPTITTAPRG